MTVAGVRRSLAWDEEPRFVFLAARRLDSRPVVERAISSATRTCSVSGRRSGVSTPTTCPLTRCRPA